MEIVYISGPYRAKTHNGVRRNILRAEAVAMKYWRLGYGVICPHKNCEMIDDDDLCDRIMEADLEILERCADKVVMVPEWENSEGSNLERNKGFALGLTIIYETEETIQEYIGQVGKV
jgi:hypothetical protein